MCLIQGQWPIYRYQPTSGLTVGQHIGLYFGQASVESWISLGQVSAGSWTSLDRESAVTCWSVYWLTLARLSTRPYSSSIATDMLTNRQLRCQPIHENSPEFCNWSIWYLMQLICVMSNSVHHVSVDSYLVTKGEALKMRLEKQVVQVMSNDNQYTTDTLPILDWRFPDTLPTHYRCYHNRLSVDLKTNTWPTVKCHSADMSTKLQLLKR